MSIAALAWAMEQGRRLKLPVAERMLLLALADRHNGDTALCCPGQETLGEDTGLTPRSISTLSQSLERRGVIRIQKVGRTRHYDLMRANGADPEPLKQPKPETVSAIAQDHSPKHRKPVPLFDPIPEAPSAVIPEPASGLDPDTGNSWNQYRKPLPPNLKSQPSKKEKEASTPKPPQAGAASEPNGFLEFWTNYPRKVGRRAAATAFAAALKRGTSPDDILDGLDRAQFQPEPRFQPHPTTWLNQDRWRDEPDTSDPVLRVFENYLDPDDREPARPFAGMLLQ